MAQRLHHQSQIPVDIVPFGAIAPDGKTISWIPDGNFEMSIIGFDDAYQAAQIVRLRDNPVVDIPVATPAALVILKLITWQEHPERGKDATDLVFLLRHYLETGHTERLIEQHSDLLEEDDFNFEPAGARLLGRDLANIVSEPTKQVLHEILSTETGEQKHYRLVEAMTNRQDGQHFENNLALLNALYLGFQELKEKGVSVTLKYIPKDVFDKRAVAKGQARFFDVVYLNTKQKIKGKKLTIQLTDFVTCYTQDDIEELQQSMRAGSKVVIDNGQIFKIEKDKNGIITRTLLTKNWHDWIDYWAIDFNYEDKKEIIKVKNEQGEIEENWTGNYLFENEWQSFRTKKNPTFEFTSVAHEYEQSGKYKIMVKVVDILGIDTSKIIDVKI